MDVVDDFTTSQTAEDCSPEREQGVNIDYSIFFDGAVPEQLVKKDNLTEKIGTEGQNPFL